jgi:hypothetical protein
LKSPQRKLLNADVILSVFETVIGNGIANMGSTPFFRTLGSLAQLDRAFPCEGKGCEFESRKDHMGKIDKKRKKLEERIEFLENEMKTNLKQKTSNTAEISVGDYMSKIQAISKLLLELK